MRVKFLFAALRWVPAFAIVCVSWHLSSLPRIEMMPSFWNADKLVHTVCFAGLAFWAAFGAKAHALRSSWIPALLVSAYGIIDEVDAVLAGCSGVGSIGSRRRQGNAYARLCNIHEQQADSQGNGRSELEPNDGLTA